MGNTGGTELGHRPIMRCRPTTEEKLLVLIIQLLPFPVDSCCWVFLVCLDMVCSCSLTRPGGSIAAMMFPTNCPNPLEIVGIALTLSGPIQLDHALYIQ